MGLNGVLKTIFCQTTFTKNKKDNKSQTQKWREFWIITNNESILMVFIILLINPVTREIFILPTTKDLKFNSLKFSSSSFVVEIMEGRSEKFIRILFLNSLGKQTVCLFN